MHPIERLRHVAGGWYGRGVDPVEEAAVILACMAESPEFLVTACRRLVDSDPANGPMWWLAARILSCAEPAGAREAARLALSELVEDTTPRMLTRALGELRGDDRPVIVAVVEPGDQVKEAMLDLGGCETHVVAEGRTLRAHEGYRGADVVLIEAWAAGTDGVVAVRGSAALAQAASDAEIPCWAVAGAGRVLPGPLWAALVERLRPAGAEEGSAGSAGETGELVAVELISSVVGGAGCGEPAAALRRVDCPVPPELLRRAL